MLLLLSFFFSFDLNLILIFPFCSWQKYKQISFIFDAELSSIDGSLGLDFLSSKKLDDFNDSARNESNNDTSMDEYLDEALSADDSAGIMSCDEFDANSIQTKSGKVSSIKINKSKRCNTFKNDIKMRLGLPNNI